jgi:hypothetical protein
MRGKLISLLICAGLIVAVSTAGKVIIKSKKETRRQSQGQGQGRQNGQRGGGQRGGQGGGSRTGAPPAYILETPESNVNVIAGATTDRSIILSVLSKTGGDVSLSFNPVGGKTSKKIAFTLLSGIPKEILLEGLNSSTLYEYSVRVGSDSITGKFATAKKSGDSFTFTIQADSHLDANSDPKVYENTLKNMLNDKPDFLVDLGDTFMVDKYPQYTDAEKQYQSQRYWFSRVGSEMSVFLCLGNHDGETGWKGKGGNDITPWAQAQREKYFPIIRPNEFYSGAPRKGLYYSWNWGDASFFVLDPFVATTQKTQSAEDGWNWTLGKEQFSWLEKSLKVSKAKYKFIFIHHLVGGFGREARGGIEVVDRFEWGDKENFPTKRSGWAEPIHEMMKRYKVTAMFHGHDHLYVRQERDGIAYIEVPQPSHGRGDSTGSAAEYGYKEGILLGSSGHIRISVSPQRAKIEYVKSRLRGINQEVVDHITLQPN